MRHLVPALIASCLTLPVASVAQAPQMAVQAYECAAGRFLSVAFINAGDESFAVLQEAGRIVPLKVAPSGSGARYLSEDGGLELWTKGDTAMLTLLGGDAEIPLYRDCKGLDQAR